MQSLFLGLILAVAAPLQAEVVSIAAARSLPAGTVVTVEGSVTVASGTFSSSMNAIETLQGTSTVTPKTVATLKQGSAITAVGYGGQYKSQHEVLIRDREDIRPAH